MDIEKFNSDMFVELGGQLLPIFDEYEIVESRPHGNDVLVLTRAGEVSELRIALADVNAYHNFGNSLATPERNGPWWQVFAFPTLGIRFVFESSADDDVANVLSVAIDKGANLR